MDKLAIEINDFPIDYYQNIIDPNLFLDENGNWIATTYLIKESFVDLTWLKCAVKFLTEKRSEL